jgi:hypothetical protein
MSEILALGSLRQEDQEFEANIGNILRRPCLKQTNKKPKRKRIKQKALL